MAWTLLFAFECGFAASAHWNVLGWDGTSVRLQWSGSLEAASDVLLGVPAGAGLNWSVVRVEGKGGLRPPSGTLEGFEISEGKRGRFRDLEIALLQIEARPTLRATGAITLELAVRFVPEAGVAGYRRTFASAETSPSERLLASLVANYAQSRMFRTTIPAVAGAKRSAIEAGSAGLPAVRAIVQTTQERIHVLTRSHLSEAGLPLDEIDPREMRLYFQGEQIPLYIEGEDDGSWDAGDYLEFIGRRPPGTELGGGRRAYNSFYTDTASLVLVWQGGRRGLRAPAFPVAGPRGGTSAVDAGLLRAGPYRVRVHHEKDLQVLRLGGVEVADVLDLGEEVGSRSLDDIWFWTSQGVEVDAVNVAFDLENAPAGVRDNSLRVRIRMQGVTDVLTAPFDHHVRFLLNSRDISESPANTAKWSGDEAMVWESGPLDPGIALLGENVLTIQKINDLVTNTGDPLRVQDAFLDYIELEYLADYRVRGDNIRFTNEFEGRESERLFDLTGLEGDGFSLWDARGRKLVGYNLLGASGGKRLTFTDAGVVATQYHLCARDKRLVPAVYLDTLDDLLSGANAADYLVLTRSALMGPQLDRLLEHRRNAGLTTRVVRVDHVYHTFGDGSPSPAAIQRFTRYAFANWSRPAPTYLMLLGDASIWFDKRTAPLKRDVVPTHLIHIPGWGITSNDDYYAKVSGEDDLPDMLVGRIPVADEEALGTVVDKLLRHERDREHGHWENKVLLLGGFETSFTRINDELQALAADAGRHVSRLDVDSLSPYFRPIDAPPSVYHQFDSAFQVVSFAGHGGGAVWSDRGLLTMEDLDRDRINGRDAVPMVFSITCLTGFFEDVDARSLGEELVRRRRSGAVAFYGASGYISNAAGRLLSRELIAAALSPGTHTAGGIVLEAETRVALATGRRFLPILGEFDLLGDPAMELTLPPVDRGALAVRLGDEGRVQVGATDLRVTDGDGVAALLDGASTLATVVAPVEAGAWSGAIALPTGEDTPLVRDGRVFLHYWDGEASRVAAGEFSSLDWLVDSLELSPPQPAVGGLARAGFRIAGLGDRLEFQGRLLYAVAARTPSGFADTASVPLEGLGGGVFRTAQPMILSSDTALARPLVFLRLQGTILVFDGGDTLTYPGVQTRIFSRPLRAPADLGWLKRPFGIPIQDELGLWTRFVNRGFGSDSGFTVTLLAQGDSAGGWGDTAVYEGALGANQADSLFFALPEEVTDLRLTARLSASRGGVELNTADNAADTLLRLRTLRLAGDGDTLRLFDDGYLGYRSGPSLRAFAIRELEPEDLPGHLEPVWTQNGRPVYYRLDFSGAVGGEYPLWAPLQAQAAAKGSRETPAWHMRKPGGRVWVLLDPPDSAGGQFARALVGERGDYSLFINTDSLPPNLHFTAKGQNLLPDDFIPINAPLQVTLRDEAGVDFDVRPPTVALGGSDLDSSKLVVEAVDALGKVGLVQWEPDRELPRDSLLLRVWDVSGNSTSQVFAYRLGRGLKVHILGTYPNPFADSAIIVYRITDQPQSVQLRIYSKAGRLVKSLRDSPESGYREVAWDGRSNSGAEVGNGLYYLKIIARQEGKSASAVFKMFKKKRK